MKKVIFICLHNSGRSQMAEAFFNQMAQGQAQAISAGSQPDDQVNPVVAEAMLEVGLDIRRNKPKLLTFEIQEGVDKAITMGCGDVGACPLTTIAPEDWELEDPKGKSLEQVRKIRDDIKIRVANLVKEMTAK